MSLTVLSPEIFGLVCRQPILSVKDLVNLMKSCKTILQFIPRNQMLWKSKFNLEYNIFT